MLLRSTFRKGLEPMRHMSDMMVQRPLLHAAGNAVGSLPVKGLAVVDAVEEGFQHVGLEILAHFRAVEDELSVVLRDLLFGDFHGKRLPLEGRPDQVQSVAFHIDLKLKNRFFVLEEPDNMLLQVICCKWLAIQPGGYDNRRPARTGPGSASAFSGNHLTYLCLTNYLQS